MHVDLARLWRPGASFFGGALVVLFLGGLVRPSQNDNAHMIGVLTAKGGTVVHSGHFQMSDGLLGQFSGLVTGSAVPPVAGDIKVEVVGPAPVRYELYSRYPPVVPLLNGLRGAWYSFEDDTFKGVKPGDSFAVTVKMATPSEPGEYDVVFSNARTKQVYLKMPIEFSAHEPAVSGASAVGECPGCN